MAKNVNVNGVIHRFPDEATESDIISALSGGETPKPKSSAVEFAKNILVKKPEEFYNSAKKLATEAPTPVSLGRRLELAAGYGGKNTLLNKGYEAITGKTNYELGEYEPKGVLERGVSTVAQFAGDLPAYSAGGALGKKVAQIGLSKLASSAPAIASKVAPYANKLLPTQMAFAVPDAIRGGEEKLKETEGRPVEERAEEVAKAVVKEGAKGIATGTGVALAGGLPKGLKFAGETAAMANIPKVINEGELAGPEDLLRTAEGLGVLKLAGIGKVFQKKAEQKAPEAKTVVPQEAPQAYTMPEPASPRDVAEYEAGKIGPRKTIVPTPEEAGTTQPIIEALQEKPQTNVPPIREFVPTEPAKAFTSPLEPQERAPRRKLIRPEDIAIPLRSGKPTDLVPADLYKMPQVVPTAQYNAETRGPKVDETVAPLVVKTPNNRLIQAVQTPQEGEAVIAKEQPIKQLTPKVEQDASLVKPKEKISPDLIGVLNQVQNAGHVGEWRNDVVIGKKQLANAAKDFLEKQGFQVKLIIPPKGPSVLRVSAKKGEPIRLNEPIGQVESRTPEERLATDLVKPPVAELNDVEVKRVAGNILKNNSDVTAKDAEAMARDVIRNRKPTAELKDPLLEEAKKYKSAEEFIKSHGKPLYHGSENDFEKFSYEFLGKQGTTEGKGFYFTDNKSIAEHYMHGEGGKLFEVYVDVKKPLNFTGKDITFPQLKKFIKALDKDDRLHYEGAGYLDNWGEIKHDGYENVLNRAAQAEYNGSDNDVDMIHSIINADGGNPENVYPVLKKTLGYDGIRVKPDWGDGQTITIAFNPEQIKTRAELTDIWNKANAPQTPEAKEGGVVESQVAKNYADKLGQPLSDYHIKFANAIANKDAEFLTKIIAQGKGFNEASKKVFSEATGVKLPTTVGGKREAIYQWAGKEAPVKEKPLPPIKMTKEEAMAKANEARMSKALEVKVSRGGKIISKKELMDTLAKEGYKAEEATKIDFSKKEKDSLELKNIKDKYLLNPSDKSKGSNPNLPQVKKGYELIEKLNKNEYGKSEYRIVSPDGSYLVVGKAEYDYFNKNQPKKSVGAAGQDNISDAIPLRQLPQEPLKVKTEAGEKVTITPKPGEAFSVTPFQTAEGKIKYELHDGDSYIIPKNTAQDLTNRFGMKPLDISLPKDLEIARKGAPLEKPEVAKARERFDDLANRQEILSQDELAEFTRLNDYLAQQGANPWLHSESLKTKYEKYTLPEGKNYREVLLKAPNNGKTLQPLNGYEKQELEKIATIGEQFRTSSQQTRYVELGEREASNWNALQDTNTFKSSHWDEPNVVAHTRLAEHNVGVPKTKALIEQRIAELHANVDKATEADVDEFLRLKKELAVGASPSTHIATKEQTTLLEEIQSDWAAKGRKDKFINEEPPEGFDVWKEADGKWYVGSKNTGATMRDGVGRTREEAIKNAWNTPMFKGSGTPYHPALKDWQTHTLKQAIKEAVDAGSDSLSWVTGEQTADRYDLSKQINRVYYLPDTQELRAFDNSRNMVINETVPKEKLADYIGKEAATRLLKTPLTEVWSDPKKTLVGHDLQGANLKMGGEWASNLYDKQIPNILKDLTKGYNTKFQDITLENGKTVHSMTITPELREAISGDKGTVGAMSKGAKADITKQEIENPTPDQINKNNNIRNKFRELATGVREYIQDDWIRVKKLLEQPDVKVEEASNPYEKEILMHGRLGSRIEDTTARAIGIIDQTRAISEKHGIKDADTIKLVNDYMLALHAPEANAEIAKVNKNFPDGGSGMTNAKAEQIISDIKGSKYGKDIEQLAETMKAMHRETLDILADGQVISTETRDALRTKYKNHVPKQRIFEDTENVSDVLAGRGLDVRGTGIQKAYGSERQVADIFTNILANRQQAIIRAEKNLVDLATLKLVRDNPQLEVFEIIKPKAIGKTFSDQPILERVTDPNVLTLRENGKPVYIKIKDPKLALALKGVNRQKVDGLIRASAVFTRLMSSLATRYNPEFVLPNMIRDVQEAVVYVASKSGFGSGLKSVAREPSSMKAITEYLIGRDTEGSRLYKQMRMDGGTTGGLGLSTRKQVEMDVEKIWKNQKSLTRKGVQTIVKSVDNFNQIFEDATRLSVYKQALNEGKTRHQAAVMAKEASVNFNKMGRGGPVINGLYMFANASIQGSAKMLKAMSNPKVAGVVIPAIGAAVWSVNQYNDNVDKDWRDKVSKWDRLNSLIVVVPSKEGFKYIALPVSWGLKPIKVGFDSLFDLASGREESAGDVASKIGTAFVDAYNPVGGTDFLQAITPTILDLPVDIGRNRKWSGGKIYPDYDKNRPADVRYFPSLEEKTTGKFFVKTMEALQEKAGIELSPAVVNYAYENLIGGAGRFGSKVINTLSSIGSDEKLSSREMPYVSRFYRDIPEDELKANFNTKDLLEAQKILQGQSRANFKIDRQADDIFKRLTKKPQDAVQILTPLLNDPNLEKLEEKIENLAIAKQKNFTGIDKAIQMMSHKDGTRGQFIIDRMKTKSKDERIKFLEDMGKKELITDDMFDEDGNFETQLIEVLSQP